MLEIGSCGRRYVGDLLFVEESSCGSYLVVDDFRSHNHVKEACFG